MIRQSTSTLKVKQLSLIHSETSPQSLISLYNDIIIDSKTGVPPDTMDLQINTISLILFRLSKLNHCLLNVDDLIPFIQNCLDANVKINSISNLVHKLLVYINMDPDSISHIVNWCQYFIDNFNNSKGVLNIMEILLKGSESTEVSPVLKLHNENPVFIQCLFHNHTSNNALVNSSSKCLATIYHLVYQELNKNTNKWFDVWGSQLHSYLMIPKYSNNIQIYLLPLVFRIDPNSFNLLLSKYSIPNSILISLIKTAKDLSIDTSAIANKDFFQNLLRINDLNVRLKAFYLLCYSLKLSKPVDPEVYNFVIENFLQFSLDCTVINDRVIFINTINNFMIRVRDSTYSGYKKNPKQVFDCDHQFMLDLIEKCRDLLLPSSTYSQMLIGYTFINKAIELDLDGQHPRNDKDNKLKFPFTVEIFDHHLMRLLFDNLNSNYEDIREMSLVMLLKCPGNVLETYLDDSNLLEVSKKLCLDLKSRKSEGGAKFFQLYCQFYSNNPQKVIFIFDLLLKELEPIPDIDLNNLQREHQIHGILTSLRLILQSLPNEFFTDTEYFTNYFSILLGLSKTLWFKIEPVISNSENQDDEEQSVGKLITTFSWKAIKELTFLTTAIFNLNTNFRFISPEKLFESIDLLADQLLGINHRGAATSIYPSFISIICICFRNKDTKEFPEQLLMKNLHSLEAKTQVISRRSGSLPNLITGILTARKITNGNCDELLQVTITKLFDIVEYLKVGVNFSKYDLPQVNALNCIKQIFIDSQLTKENQKYLNQTLSCCLKHFKSINWSIRNCALMLFTTLQNKLFNGRTKLLSHVFFSRYDLRSLLLNYLKADDFEIVYPILMILSNLNFNTDEGVIEFKNVLINLLDNCRWKVREIIARALAEIIPSNSFTSTISELIQLLDEKRLNLNHGIMLTILEMYKRGGRVNDEEVLGLIKYKNWAHVKTYVDILEFIQVPHNIAYMLMDIFVNNMDEGSNGIRVLAMENILRFLLNYHQIHKQNKYLNQLIEISIDNFSYRVIIIDSLLNHETQVDYKLFWEHMGNNNYMRYKVLELLNHYKAPNINEYKPILEPLMESDNEDISSKSLQLLANVPNEKYYEVMEKYYQDDSSVTVRQNCIQAVMTSLINTKTKGDNYQLKLLLILIKSLQDELETIRQQTMTFLEKYLNIGYDVMALELYHNINNFVKSNFTENVIEQTVVNAIIEYTPSVETKLNEFLLDYNDQQSLFEAEMINSFRSDALVIRDYINLLPKHVTKSLKLNYHCQEQVNRVLNMITSFQTDGPIGYTKNQLVYTSIEQTLELVNYLETEDIKDTKTKIITTFEQFCIHYKLHQVSK